MLRAIAVIAVIAAAAEAKPARSAAISAKLEARHRRFQKVNAKAIFNAINGKAKPAVASASGTSACGTYTTEQQCEDVADVSDNCIWALPHGAQDDWEDEEDEVCRPMRCHDVESADSSGDEGLACSTWLGGTCAFNTDSYVCWERGQTPDCEYRGAWEASMCPSPCEWDSADYVCNTPGSAAVCGRAYDSTSCGVMASTGCTWTAGQTVDGWDECGVCYNRSRFTSGTPCDAYFGKPETCCPQSQGCHWTVVMAPETEEPGMPNDEPPMVEDGDGRCTAEGEILACESYEDEDDCPRDRCNFIREDEYSGLCVPDGREVPCRRLQDRECSETTSCLWNIGTTEEPGMEDPDGACEDCPAGTNCTQTYVGPGGPDNGLPCASHTEENCPFERCAVGFAGNSGGDDTPDFNDWECSGDAGGGEDGGGVCRDPACEDEFEEDACGAKAGCGWSADCYTCYSTAQGAAFPCDKCFDATSCPSSGCTWQAAMSGCGSDMDGESGACIVTGGDVPCKQIETSTASCCPANCHWDAVSASCNEADYQKSCESYGATVSGTNGCPTSRCTVTLGICHSQSSTLVCTDICNQYLCSSSGSCHWDKEANSGAQCTTGAANVAACNTLTADNCYDEEQCAFIAGQCTDAVCSDIFSPEVCGSKSNPTNGNCAWHDNTGCYFNGEDLPCGHYYEQGDCPADRCNYDASCYLCLDAGEECPCHFFWGATECPSGRCTWTDNSCELDAGNIVPPALNGGGDSNMAHCTAAMQAALHPVLDAAAEDCISTGEASPTATADQLKCLDYYLTHASPVSSFTAACPCLHFWAEHENPTEAFWMAVNC